MNTKHVIIHDEIISIGTIDQSIAHPRDIYAPALIHSASAVILVHNHPSGDNTPSKADLDLTKKCQFRKYNVSIFIRSYYYHKEIL